MKLSNLLQLIGIPLLFICFSSIHAYTYKTTNKTDINPATGQPFIDPVSGEIAIDPETGKPYINPWTRQPDIGTEIQIIIPLAATDHDVRSKGIKPGQYEKVNAGGWWSGYCLEDNVRIRPLCNGNPIPQRGLKDCLIFDKNLEVAYYEYKVGINPLGSSFWGMMDYATGGATTIARMTVQLAGGGGGSNIDVLTFMSKSESISKDALKKSMNLFLLTTDPKKLASELDNQLKNFRKELSGAQKELEKDTKEYEKLKKDTWQKAVKPEQKQNFEEGLKKQEDKSAQAKQAIDPLQQAVDKLGGELATIKAALDKNATPAQKQASSQAIQSIKEAAMHDAVLSARTLRLAQTKGLPDNLELDKPVTDNELKIIASTIGSSTDKAIKLIETKLDDLIKSMNVKAKAAPVYTCHNVDVKAVEAQAKIIHLGVHLLQRITQLKPKEPWSSLAKDPSYLKEWRMDDTNHLFDATKSVANAFKELISKNEIKGNLVITPELLNDADQKIRAATDKKATEEMRYLALRAIDQVKVMAEFAVISAVRTILDLDGKKLQSGVTISSPPTIMERDALHVVLPLNDEKIIFFLENIIQKEASDISAPVFIAESKVPDIAASGLSINDKSENIYSIVQKVKDLRLISRDSESLIKEIVKAFPDKKKLSSAQVAAALSGGDYIVLETIPDQIVVTIKKAVDAAEGSTIARAVKNEMVIALLGLRLLKSMGQLEVKDPGTLKQWGVNNTKQFVDTLQSTSSDLKKFRDKNKDIGDFDITHDLLDDATKKLSKVLDKNASDDDRLSGLQALDTVRIAAESSVIMAVKTILILDGKMIQAGTAITSAPTVKEQQALQGALNLTEDKIISLLENVVLTEVNDGKAPIFTDDSKSVKITLKDVTTKAKNAYDIYKKVDGFVNNVKKYAQAIQDVIKPPTPEVAAAAGTKETVAAAQASSGVVEVVIEKLPEQVSSSIKDAMNEIKGIKTAVEGAVTDLTNEVKSFSTFLSNMVISDIEQSIVGVAAKELTGKAAQAIIEQSVKTSVTQSVETALKNAAEEAQKAGKTLTVEAANDVTKQAVQEAANSAKNVISKVTNNAEVAGKIAQAISDVAEQTGKAVGEATGSVAKVSGEAIGKAAAEAVGKAAGSAAAEVAAELGVELAAATALRAVEIATGPIGVLVQLGSMVAVGLAGAFCAAAAFCGDHAMLVTRKPVGQMGFNVSIKGAC